jgi:transcriptional regulator with XRE-family HTH domain
MSDTSKMAMGPSVDRVQRLPTPLEESVRRTESVPASALKELRGNRSQIEIARAAGISQPFLSELERGRKGLTRSTAQKLAAALETTPDHLMLAERHATLNRAAHKGRVDPKPLLGMAERLAEVLPSGKIGDAIVGALIGIVRERPKMFT